MKNSYQFLRKGATLLSFVVLLTSCFKDTSTLDNNSIVSYIINPEKDKTFSVSVVAGENLKIDPEIVKVYKGDTIRNVDDELSYCWKVATNPADLDTMGIVLFNNKTLDMPIPVPANVMKYSLTLTIVDRDGIQTTAEWRLQQSSEFYDGLFIAETDNDGATSDVSLIMANEVSRHLPKYSERKTFHSIFSLSNGGEKLRGETSQIKEGRVEYVLQLTFLSEKSKTLTRVDGTDMTIIDKDQERFMIPQDYFAPTYFGNGYNEVILVNNGLLNCQSWQQNEAMLYSYPMESDMDGYYCSKWYSHSPYSWDGSFEPRGVIYDELNGRFLAIPGKFAPTLALQKFKPNNGGAFDLNDVKNKKCEMAGTMSNGKHIFMLRDKATLNLSMYVLAADLETDNGKIGLEIIDMTSFPDINNVVSYVVSNKELTIYYATKNKIYALLMTGGGARVEERYTTPSGTIITTMEMMGSSVRYIYKTEKDENGKDVDYAINLGGRMLIIALYNESTREGSIRNQYIESLGAGIFSSEYVWEYEGFNKITAVKAVTYEE